MFLQIMPIVMTSQKIWFLNSIPSKDHWEIRFVIFRIKGCLQLVYWEFIWIISRHIHRLSIKTNSARYQQIEFRDFILYLLSFFRFDVRDRPMSIARVYSDQTLFDEPTRAVMNVTTSPAALIISKLIPADSGR